MHWDVGHVPALLLSAVSEQVVHHHLDWTGLLEALHFTGEGGGLLSPTELLYSLRQRDLLKQVEIFNQVTFTISILMIGMV